MSNPDNIEYVVINRETMKFVTRTPNGEIACLVMNLEPVDATYVMLPLDLKSRFSKFGLLELMLLYKNTVGENHSSGIHDYATMVAASYGLAKEVPMEGRSVFDMNKELANLPKPAADIPPPPRPAPIIVRTDPNAAPYVPPPPVPKAPAAPKAPGVKPSKGSTGRVWEVADAVRAEMGGGPITKEMRAAIIARCETQGINAGTAATQYGKWKATQS